MRELSLHILDIIQNSIVAEADLIELVIHEDIINDKLVIKIIDNGCGMDSDLQKRVLSPFVTTRTTRKVGLGLPLFKAAAEQCKGSLKLSSTLGEGTKVVANFKYSHIDRAPIGDIVGTIFSLISVNPKIDLLYRHIIQEDLVFDTRLIKKEIDPLEINHPEVLTWIKGYLEEGLQELRR